MFYRMVKVQTFNMSQFRMTSTKTNSWSRVKDLQDLQDCLSRNPNWIAFSRVSSPTTKTGETIANDLQFWWRRQKLNANDENYFFAAHVDCESVNVLCLCCEFPCMSMRYINQIWNLSCLIRWILRFKRMLNLENLKRNRNRTVRS